MAFANGTNKCPDWCEKGETGEHKKIRLELKVLADCGLVGFPSVGKSTLISAVSAVKPKIADYHFTTLAPNLGMVYVEDGRSFVMADLPGLIEGASQGLGLGFQFLRHIERCRVIVHVIDISASEGRDPYEDYLKIRKELEEYQLNLLERPEIIACNKMDEPGAEELFEEFKSHFDDDKIIVPISAYCGLNTDKLVYDIANVIDKTPKFEIHADTVELVEYNFKEEEKFFDITVEKGVYVVSGAQLKRIFDMTDFNNETAMRRFARQLRFLGVDQALRDKGIKDGDTVNVFGYEFEFYE
jgi:GTP-binding protein